MMHLGYGTWLKLIVTHLYLYDKNWQRLPVTLTKKHSKHVKFANFCSNLIPKVCKQERRIKMMHNLIHLQNKPYNTEFFSNNIIQI